MWASNIESLKQYFRVYAIDTIDDIGKSRCVRRIRSRQEYAEWLNEVYGELKIEKAHLAGVSYGGWISFQFALYEPEKIGKIVSISPAATFRRIRATFYLKAVPAIFMPGKAIRRHFRIRFFCWLSGETDGRTVEDHPLWRQYACAASHSRWRRFVPPNVLHDWELKTISAPILLMIGDQEVIYDPQKVLDRARNTMPNIITCLIAGGTHMMSWNQSETINDRMIAYLSDDLQIRNHGQ